MATVPVSGSVGARPSTDTGVPPAPAKARGANATAAALVAPVRAEEHHDPQIRWSKDVAAGFVKKTQSFAFGCVPLQGIWLIYTLVLVGFLGLGEFIWSYNLNQIVLYLGQRGQPLRCENLQSEVRSVDLSVRRGEAEFVSSLACYIITQVYECGQDDGAPLTHNATCPLPEGTTEVVNILPTQLGADDPDRPDADCFICYGGSSFYRRVDAEQLVDPQCRETFTEDEFRARCESLLELPPYRCWLGLEGNEEHGQLIAYDGDIDGFAGTDTGRIEFPLKMVILASIVTVLYVLYLLKKFKEAVALWLESQREHHPDSDSEEGGVATTSAADATDSQFDRVVNAPAASVLFEFSCVQHPVFDTDGLATLEVIRRGQRTQTVSVPYSTQNVSMDPQNYIKAEGQLVFPEGSDRQSISVAFGTDAIWENVAVFAVKLGAPRATTKTEDVQVGLGLHHQATVAVCNTTKFPNNLEGDLSELGLVTTVTAFFLHVWRIKRTSFLKCLAYKMGEPFCYLIRKCIELRLFDNTLDLNFTRDFPLGGEWTREKELSALAFVYLVVFFLDWYLEIWHELWAPVNSVRTANRKAVFTKMLYLEPHLAQSLSLGRVHEMMQTAVEEATYHAWYTFSMAIGTALKIMVQLGFLVYIGSYEESKTVLIILPLLVVIEGIIYALRIRHGMKLQREYMKQEGERIDFTNAGLRSREVMLRYNQIEPASQKFDALHSAEMWARFQFLLYNFNTSYLGQLVPVLMYALCMVVMGKEAVSKDSGVKIGDVVLVLSTLSGFSSSIASLANRLVKVGRGFLGVEILAEFLNQPSILDATLLATRLDSSLHASMSTLTQDEQNENALLHQTLCVDQEHQPLNEQEIVVKDAMFDVDLKTEGIQSYGFNLVLKQGSFSLLLGAEGSGKTTLLKLLEGELQVDAGAIFTPAHLARRLVTAKEKNTVHGTVLENVLFGGDPLHAARSEPTWTVQQLRTSAEQHGWSRSGSASSARVRALLEALDESSEARKELAIEMKKLGTEELGEMAREFGLHRNGKATMVQMLEADVDTLSTTQCMIVAVVRAILAGTDFLLLDGIFDQLHSSTLTSLVQALMHWQETHSGMGSTGCGDSPKTILVAVRNSLMPATVLELCPSVTTVETFVSHSLRDGGDDAGGGQAVLPQLSTDVPPVPDADADAEAQRPEEAMPPSLPPTPDDIAANP